MSASLVARLLRPGVQVHPELFDLMGSMHGAIFIAEAAWATEWALNNRGDGWFYRSQSEWRDKALLGEVALRSARSVAKRLGVLDEEKRKGIPPRIWYRINLKELESLLIQQISQRRGTPLLMAGTPAYKDGEPRGLRTRNLANNTLSPLPQSTSTNQPAAKGGGKSASTHEMRERLSCELVFGLRWKPEWSRWLPEDRAVGILFRQGVRDPDRVRRVLGEWAATGDRGFKKSAAGVLVSNCQKGDLLSHTADGDARMPDWA